MRSDFWATHTGAEMEVLIMKGRRPYDVAVKVRMPREPPETRIALEELCLAHLTGLYPGDQCYTLDRHITMVSVAHLAADPGVVTPSARGRRA